MNLRLLPIKLTFGLTLFLFLLFACFKPPYLPPFNYFTPFLICMIYRSDKNRALWLAAACGFILDLFSSYTHFGFYSVSNVVALWLFYGMRRHFFADHLTTLPILTALYSLLLTTIELLLLFLLDQGISLTWQWMVFDGIVLSVADALYALLGFVLPLWLLMRLRRWIRSGGFRYSSSQDHDQQGSRVRYEPKHP